MRVPGRCEPHPRGAEVRLGMVQAEAPAAAGPHAPAAILEDRVDHVGRQSFFLSVVDPLTVLAPVQPRAGSHPQDAIAAGRNGPDAIQSRPQLRPSPAVEPQQFVPAPDQDLAGRELREFKCPRLGESIGRSEHVQNAIPPNRGAVGTAEPERAIPGFEQTSDVVALPGRRQIHHRPEFFTVINLEPVAGFGDHPERSVVPLLHQTDGAPFRVRQGLETAADRVEKQTNSSWPSPPT